MPYSAKAIANFFIDLAKADGKSLTPMKVQKLVYFAHGWHLALAGQPLIDEQVEAWKFGPVIRTLYAELAAYGNKPIENKITTFDWDASSHVAGKNLAFRMVCPDVDSSDKNTRDFLRKVWDVYGGYTAVQLSNLTHEPGSPWDTVNKRYGGELPKGTDIETDLIKDYFEKKAK